MAMEKTNTKSITTSKRLFHNTIFNVANLVISVVIGFLMIPFFIGKLGTETYGIWILIASIFQYRTMFCVGLASAVNRYVAVYSAKQDSEGMSRVLSTSICYYLFVSGLLFVATLVAHHYLNRWFTISEDNIVQARQLVLIVGFSFSATMPAQVFSAMLSGYQRYDKENIAILIPVLIRTALLIVFLSSGYGLITMGIIFGTSQIVIAVFQFLFARKLFCGSKMSYKHTDFTLFREMLSYGINSFMYAMSALIIFKASDIIIGVFLTPTDITRYSLVVAAVMILSQFLQTFIRAIKPAVSDLDACNDQTKICQIAILSQKYSLVLLLPAVSFLIMMGKEFLWIWVGPEFASLSIIMTILSIGHFFRLAQYSNYVVLVGKGEHRVFGVLTITMAIIAVVLAVVSIKVFKMGLFGIALANFVPMLLVGGIVLPIYTRRKLNISFRDIICLVWLPAIKGCFPTIILIGAWKYLFPPTSWFSIGMVVVSSMLLTAIGCWLLTFTEIERKRFFNILVPGWLRPKR